MRLAQKRTIPTYDHAPQHKVSVWARHIGRTSFTFRIAGSEAIISTAETIYVLVDSAALSKTPLRHWMLRRPYKKADRDW
ncbi:MAG: hypothetical protein M3436_17255 [Pseudomonadota bacterium]|nr:hypothetical protein [Pseudomonadota bacterium]